MIVAEPGESVKGFAKIPHAVTFNHSLTPTARDVLAVLLYFAKGRPFCEPTDEQIGDRLNRSRRTVSVCLRALEAAGLIRREAAPKRNVAGRVIHVVGETDAKAPPLPAPREAASNPLPPPTRSVADPQAANRVPPSGQPLSSRARSSQSELKKKEEVVDGGEPHTIESLPGKPERVPAVADALIQALGDNKDYRPRYVKWLGKIASGEIEMERGVWAVAEARKRAKGRGLVFFDALQSTDPIPTPRPDPYSPEVVAWVQQARSPEGRLRQAGLAALGALGYSSIEIQGLFAAHGVAPTPPPPAPSPSAVDPEAASHGQYLRDLVRQHRRAASTTR